jgi:hypothetical protein
LVLQNLSYLAFAACQPDEKIESFTEQPKFEGNATQSEGRHQAYLDA